MPRIGHLGLPGGTPGVADFTGEDVMTGMVGSGVSSGIAADCWLAVTILYSNPDKKMTPTTMTASTHHEPIFACLNLFHGCICYFPIQNSLKILSSRSSLAVSPVISPSAL